MEGWEKLKSVDIRTVNRDGLIDVTRIPEDDSDDVDKEMQMRTFLRNVKNPYCYGRRCNSKIFFYRRSQPETKITGVGRWNIE
jgi:hypothetical protein